MNKRYRQREATALDGKQLRTLFQQFNQQYFGGRLPAYAIRVVRSTPSGRDLVAGRCSKKRRLIEVLYGLPDDEAIGTLLHEMAHAASAGGHGTSWKKEMIRLRNAGAPLSSAEMMIDLDTWDGKRVTKAHFRGVTQDVVADNPDITLSGVIRYFQSTEGGPDTIKSFLKKCPWAGTILEYEKRRYNEEQKRIAEYLATLAKTTTR